MYLVEVEDSFVMQNSTYGEVKDPTNVENGTNDKIIDG
jgi:hypothetical protein